MISRLYVGHLKYEYEFCGNGKVSICDAGRHFISHVLGPLRDQSVQYVLLWTICHTALALTTKDMESRTSSQQKIFWFLNPDLYSIIFSKIVGWIFIETYQYVSLLTTVELNDISWLIESQKQILLNSLVHHVLLRK